jgi:serine/threonine protein kinase
VRDALAPLYEVERELGQGGMATVYLAIERKHDRRVAVKVLRPEIAAMLGPDRFLRAQGIVHRDIKPENIMLPGGVAVVADFGITMAIGQAGSSRLTDPGFSVGTPTYMSPEQVSGSVDGRSDIYSLGCVVYEMLAGEPPSTGRFRGL